MSKKPDPKDDQMFRKHLKAFLTAVTFAFYITGLAFLIGGLVNFIIGAVGLPVVGWIAGVALLAYLLCSGLISDTFNFFINAAKRVADAIADGYYGEDEAPTASAA